MPRPSITVMLAILIFLKMLEWIDRFNPRLPPPTDEFEDLGVQCTETQSLNS